MNNVRKYTKHHAGFKCTNIFCQRTWISVNAWIAIDNIFCKTCNCSVTVENIQDKLVTLTIYACTNLTCPSYNIAQRQWWPFPDSKTVKCQKCQIPIVHTMSTPMVPMIRTFPCKISKETYVLFIYYSLSGSVQLNAPTRTAI